MPPAWTIDHVAHLFAILCNPLFVSLIPLTVLTSTHHTTTSPLFQYSAGLSVSLWLITILRRVDRYWSQGSHSPTARPDCKVIVITGAANGLGAMVAREMSMRDHRVVSLDLCDPRDPVTGVLYLTCDVSNRDSLRRAHETILAECGRVDVVLSSAGAMSCGSILEMDGAEVERLLRVNLLSHFIVAQTFLPAMMAQEGKVRGGGGGHWVTVASTLGYVGVECLGAYCAAKSGTLAFHESLSAEVRRRKGDVEMTLVVPGQLDTDMFAGIETPNGFLAPVVEALDLAHEIVDKIERRVGGVFGYPLYANYMGLMRVLPTSLVRALRWFAGLDAAAVQLASKSKAS